MCYSSGDRVNRVVKLKWIIIANHIIIVETIVVYANKDFDDDKQY